MFLKSDVFEICCFWKSVVFCCLFNLLFISSVAFCWLPKYPKICLCNIYLTVLPLIFNKAQYYIWPLLLHKLKIPPKYVGISTSFPEPPVTNVHQNKVWYDEYICPWPESKRIGAIHGQWDQELSDNSDASKKIIFSAQTFPDPVRRDHSLILTPTLRIWTQILLQVPPSA